VDDRLASAISVWAPRFTTNGVTAWHPVVVLIPGLDSAKEEFRTTEQLPRARARHVQH